MRPFIITALLVLTAPAQLAAQSMVTMPQTTYPEAGTFCGLLTLCPPTERTKEDS